MCPCQFAEGEKPPYSSFEKKWEEELEQQKVLEDKYKTLASEAQVSAKYSDIFITIYSFIVINIYIHVCTLSMGCIHVSSRFYNY